MVMEFSHVTLPVFDKLYAEYSLRAIPAMGQLLANERQQGGRGRRRPKTSGQTEEKYNGYQPVDDDEALYGPDVTDGSLRQRNAEQKRVMRSSIEADSNLTAPSSGSAPTCLIPLIPLLIVS